MSSLPVTPSSTPSDGTAPRKAALLLAKSSITGASEREMQALVERLQAGGAVEKAVYAFSEQGVPTLREVLTGLGDAGFEAVSILPWTLPMEPGFKLWIDRSTERWRIEDPSRRWPAVTVTPPPSSTPAMESMMTQMLAAEPLRATPPAPAATGSIVPPQKRRVLVCQGGPCNNAGAPVVWGHLRNEQKRLNLRTEGEGVMTAKATCLGPCNLAPVLQVFPEGTYYGGVDEAGVDRIIHEHLLGGKVVAELAYEPLPEKQHLRRNTL